jgi:hypothetical protein
VVLLVVLLSTLPGFSGIRSALAGASPGWVVAALIFQPVSTIGAVVFVQEVFVKLPKRLSWWQGCGQQGANAVLTTTASTAVSYLSVHSVGWDTYRFAQLHRARVDREPRRP